MDLLDILENILNLCIDFLNLWIWLAFRIWVWYLIEMILLMNYHAETTMRLVQQFVHFLDHLLRNEELLELIFQNDTNTTYGA